MSFLGVGPRESRLYMASFSLDPRPTGKDDKMIIYISSVQHFMRFRQAGITADEGCENDRCRELSTTVIGITTLCPVPFITCGLTNRGFFRDCFSRSGAHILYIGKIVFHNTTTVSGIPC